METNNIVDIIKTLIAKLGIVTDGVEVSEAAGHTLFTVVTRDSGALIGSRGDTLSALNHVVKKIVESKYPSEQEPFRFVVDVNGYHLKHIKMLESQAHMLAERARTFKYDIDMSPMNPYDRLIVHAALSGAPDITTESRGEGALRHIVIHYVGGMSDSPSTAGDTPSAAPLP